MREQDRHAHATTRYQETGIPDYVNLFTDTVRVKIHNYLSLNIHIPFELQHPTIYPQLQNGLHLIQFGEALKKIFQINLYWENAPEETYGIWDLRFGQTHWEYVPRGIDLCLDVGHLMIGAKDAAHARTLIRELVKTRGPQIKHLHFHENDLLHDDHNHIGHIITPELFQELIPNRTYIFEKGEQV